MKQEDIYNWGEGQKTQLEPKQFYQCGHLKRNYYPNTRLNLVPMSEWRAFLIKLNFTKFLWNECWFNTQYQRNWRHFCIPSSKDTFHNFHGNSSWDAFGGKALQNHHIFYVLYLNESLHRLKHASGSWYEVLKNGLLDQAVHVLIFVRTLWCMHYQLQIKFALQINLGFEVLKDRPLNFDFIELGSLNHIAESNKLWKIKRKCWQMDYYIKVFIH